MKSSILKGLSLSLSLAHAGCGGALDPSDGEEEGAFPASVPAPVTGVTVDEDGRELTGVRICVEGSEEHCTTTAADGSWTLAALPYRQQLWLTFHKTGFVPVLRPVFLADDASTPLGLDETVLSPASGADAEANIRPLGAISFRTSWGDVHAAADARVALIGVDDDTQDTTYTGATEAEGVFADVAPGDYLMTFQSEASACGSPAPEQADSGYLAGFPIALRNGRPLQVAVVVRVVAGYVTGPVIGACDTVEVPAR